MVKRNATNGAPDASSCAIYAVPCKEGPKYYKGDPSRALNEIVSEVACFMQLRDEGSAEK